MIASVEEVKKRCIIDDQDCWLWTEGRTSGYAQIYMPSVAKTNRGHRLVYMLVKGEIPNDLPLDHLCKNTICVNPDHLEPVTQKENVLRGVGITAKFATQTHCLHGHPYEDNNLFIRKNGARQCTSCVGQREKDDRSWRRQLVGQSTFIKGKGWDCCMSTKSYRHSRRCPLVIKLREDQVRTIITQMRESL